MNFSEFATYLERLEDTSKRLEITDILAEMITNLNKDEVSKALYLSLGYLKPAFEDEKFNMADKMAIKAIARATEVKDEDVQKTFNELGDLGNTFAQLQRQTPDEDLTISEVYEELLKIAESSGTGSQDKKIGLLSDLLIKLDQRSAKYVVRIVLGTMRLGFTEITVIDALLKYLGEDKKAKKKIGAKYNIHPDIGLIATTIVRDGLEGIERIKIETGIPILAQKAQRIASAEEIIEKLGIAWAEYKFDGTRVQLHFDKNKTVKKQDEEQQNLFSQEQKERAFIKTFTRNLEETSYQYPDLIEAVKKQLDVENVILDGEIIGYDKETGEFLPFQQIMQRKRKHNIKELALEVPIKYFVFDILYLNGESLLDRPLRERHAIAESIVKEGDVIIVDEYFETSSPEEVHEYFEKARDKGLEGLVVKKPDSPYEAGARSYNWVKLKVADVELLNDTIDCVVLGYYFGKGVRTAFGIGGFLVGVYDEKDQVFKTLTKVGTGLKEDDWLYLKKEADKVKTDQKPKNVVSEKLYEPDVWLNPEIVVELGGDEISKSSTHSSGYALRFPRLIKFRTDKSAIDITTITEIKQMHESKIRGSY